MHHAISPTIPRAALVTGGAKRLGRALSLALAEAGFDIAIHYATSAAEAEEVAGAVRALGRRAVTLKADLAREAEVAGLVPAATAALGPLGVLVNNASTFERDEVADATRASWDLHLEPNLRAPFVLAQGFAVALPGYTLAPEARISEMTAEIALAVWFVATRVPGRMVITGHSAGGHLAARMASADIVVPVDRVVPISPLTELGPMMATSMNATLAIDEDEAARESPARLAKRPEVDVRLWVGADERPAFLWQTRVLSEEWHCPWTAEPGRHHLDVIEGLENPSSPLTEALLAGL